MALPQDPGSIHSTYMAAHSQNVGSMFQEENGFGDGLL